MILYIKVTEENLFDFLKGMGVYDDDKRSNVDSEVCIDTGIAQWRKDKVNTTPNSCSS